MKESILVISVSNLAKGGVATVVTTFMKNELLNSKFNIHYFHSHNPKNFLTKWMSFFLSCIYFPILLLKNNFSVVHIHGSLKGSFIRKSYFLIWVKLFRIPIIYQCHAAEAYQYFNSKNEFQLRIINRIFSLYTLRLCLGSKGLKLFEDKTNMDWNILYNPVRTLNLSPKSDSNCHFTFMGELSKRKGIVDLIKAFSLSKNDNAKLFVAGNGDIDALRKTCTKLGIENKVEFLGWINESEKLDLLAKTDVVVLPSYAEGLPMSILEAMSAGLPVITTPVGSVEDAITNKKHGLLVEPGNIDDLRSALDELTSDKEKRECYGSNAKTKFHQNFEDHVVAKKLSQYYTSLISES